MTSDIFKAALVALEGGLGVRQLVKLKGSHEQSACGLSPEQDNGSGIKVKVSLSLCDLQLC